MLGGEVTDMDSTKVISVSVCFLRLRVESYIGNKKIATEQAGRE